MLIYVLSANCASDSIMHVWIVTSTILLIWTSATLKFFLAVSVSIHFSLHLVLIFFFYGWPRWLHHNMLHCLRTHIMCALCICIHLPQTKIARNITSLCACTQYSLSFYCRQIINAINSLNRHSRFTVQCMSIPKQCAVIVCSIECIISCVEAIAFYQNAHSTHSEHMVLHCFALNWFVVCEFLLWFIFF